MSDMNEMTLWWRDEAATHGRNVIDVTLRGSDSWAALLISGEQEIAKAVSITGMRTGPELSCLEVGCGMGRLTFALGERFGHVTGVDVNPEFIGIAQVHNDRANLCFELVDGKELSPRSSKAFDVVFSYEVFSHLPDTTVKSYISAAYTLLRPTGQMVLEFNTRPISWQTRTAAILRRCLNMIGVREWRGFPTARAFRRIPRTAQEISIRLQAAGFLLRNVVGEKTSATWFVAERP
jgi:2-polyprenyl-3-methyl-5-hydroxy-6-metoxy-1,4-benzoquinol methylase